MEQLSEAVEVLTTVIEPIPAEAGGIGLRAALVAVVNAARFAVEASQRLDTLQAELAACQAMAQRLATEAGQGGLTAAELRTLAGAAEDTAYLLTAPGDDCTGLLLAAEAARMAAGRMEASDDSE
jgi:hypothetical protein